MVTDALKIASLRIRTVSVRCNLEWPNKNRSGKPLALVSRQGVFLTGFGISTNLSKRWESSRPTMVNTFEGLLGVLVGNGVRFTLVGGLAVSLNGFVRTT